MKYDTIVYVRSLLQPYFNGLYYTADIILQEALALRKCDWRHLKHANLNQFKDPRF